MCDYSEQKMNKGIACKLQHAQSIDHIFPKKKKDIDHVYIIN